MADEKKMTDVERIQAKMDTEIEKLRADLERARLREENEQLTDEKNVAKRKLLEANRRVYTDSVKHLEAAIMKLQPSEEEAPSEPASSSVFGNLFKAAAAAPPKKKAVPPVPATDVINLLHGVLAQLHQLEYTALLLGQFTTEENRALVERIMSAEDRAAAAEFVIDDDDDYDTAATKKRRVRDLYQPIKCGCNSKGNQRECCLKAGRCACRRTARLCGPGCGCYNSIACNNMSLPSSSSSSSSSVSAAPTVLMSRRPPSHASDSTYHPPCPPPPPPKVPAPPSDDEDDDEYEWLPILNDDYEEFNDGRRMLVTVESGGVPVSGYFIYQDGRVFWWVGASRSRLSQIHSQMVVFDGMRFRLAYQAGDPTEGEESVMCGVCHRFYFPSVGDCPVCARDGAAK